MMATSIFVVCRLIRRRKLHCYLQRRETSITIFMICSACGRSLVLIFCLLSSGFFTNLNVYWFLWIRYELAAGDSHFRQGSLGRALKKYLAVEKHYADMVEDQFDFHTYCIRKMTLRAYIRMLKFQDNLHSYRFFHRAAASSIRWNVGIFSFLKTAFVIVHKLTSSTWLHAFRCYLRLFDNPPKAAAEEADAAAAGLPPAERKKLRQKQRKEAARAKKVCNA